MALVATYHTNDPVMAPYTPGADVAAGTVFVQGVEVRIAHNDIKANKQGAVACGGGLYRVLKDANAIGDGVIVYWDDTAKVVTATAASNKKFGTCKVAALAGDTDVLVQHIANNV